MAYIGREPQIGNYQVCDAISVVNAQAAYTMQVGSVDVIPESVNHMIVSLNGVIQKPGSSYTIASATITFSRNLVTGETIDFIYLLGNVLDLGTPSDSTVTSGKLSGNLVTPGTLDLNGQELILDANANTSITADTDDQIDIKVAGADDFKITANTFEALASSVIKTNTINETTSGSGVTIDGLTFKDGNINESFAIVGTTPTLTIGDAGAEDAKIVFDGNAQDFHIGLDDSADDLVIGLGSALGTTSHIVMNETGHVTKPLQPAFQVVPASEQTIENTTEEVLIWGTERFDVASNFASNVFTAPVTGKYAMNVIFYLRNLDTDMNQIAGNLLTSNKPYYFQFDTDGIDATMGYQTTNINVIADMDAGDTAQVKLSIESGTNLLLGTDANWSGMLIG